MITRNLLATSSLIAAALVSGCASYDKELHQAVSVRSEPEDAQITVNGKRMGRTTNTEFVLKRDQDYVIEISKSGYKTSSVRLNHHNLGEGSVPQFELDNTEVSVTLEENPNAVAERLALAERDAADKLAAEKAEKAVEAMLAKDANSTPTADKGEPAAVQAAATTAATEQPTMPAAAVEQAAEKQEAQPVITAPASAENTPPATRIAELEAKLDSVERSAKTATAEANEKIARLETELAQAKDSMSNQSRPLSNTSSPLNLYKQLRARLKSGEITKAEYDASVAKIGH